MYGWGNIESRGEAIVRCTSNPGAPFIDINHDGDYCVSDGDSLLAPYATSLVIEEGSLVIPRLSGIGIQGMGAASMRGGVS
jgi:hypothetical protein